MERARATFASCTLVHASLPPWRACVQSAKRKERLAILAEAAGAVGRGGTFRFLWAEAGAQAAFEGSFGIGMTPAVVAVSENVRAWPPGETCLR